MTDIIMVFDVESVGLYGDGYAVGLTVINRDDKTILDKDYFACPSQKAEGNPEDRTWIETNVDPYLPSPNLETPAQVRSEFWRVFQGWKNSPDLKRYSDAFFLFADCGYPVETNFMAACVRDNEPEYKWNAPYPLHEVATIRAILGLDATLSYDLPKDKRHNPVEECLYIAPILVDWLNMVEDMRSIYAEASRKAPQ
ncbi:hypothetical protein [Allocoleopsis sp.]|uniref:hypothetical protein n=1 Tax=Allocoleopsis sp. TaxID=3088169 RepID=UPI002FD6DED1